MSADAGWHFDAGDHIAALAWLPDGRTLAVAPTVGKIALLDRASGKVTRSLAGHALGNCALSAAAGLLVSAGQDGFARLWHTDTGELAWDSSSRYLASGGGEIITVWDVSGKGPRGTKPLQLEGHKGRVTQLAFQHGRPVLASGGVDGRVFIWNLERSLRHRHELIPPSSIAALAWSPDDSALAIGSADGVVRVLERGAA